MQEIFSISFSLKIVEWAFGLDTNVYIYPVATVRATFATQALLDFSSSALRLISYVLSLYHINYKIQAFSAFILNVQDEGSFCVDHLRKFSSLPTQLLEGGKGS